MLRFWFLQGVLSALLVASQAQETVPISDPVPLPAAQSAFSTTFRAVSAAWTRLDAKDNWTKEKTPVFTSTWELASPWPKGHNVLGDMRYPWDLVRLLSVHGPDGTPLEAVLPDARNGSNEKLLQFFVRSADVNPKWPFISVEWEILDPAATTEMAGQRSSLATWKTLDFPTKAGQKIAVGRTIETPVGTEITLNSIERLADAEEHSQQFEFDLKVEPGETAPDTETRLTFDHLNGEKSYQSKVSGGRSDGSHFVERRVVASPVGKEPLSLSFQVGETSVALQERSHYKRLRFQIPVAPIWNSPPLLAVPATPVLPIQTAHVRGQIESARLDNYGNWHALLWLQAPVDAPVADNQAPDGATAPESNWRYFFRGGDLLKPDGQTSHLWPWLENTRFVHLDGTGAAPGERSQLLGAEAPPFDLTLHFERGRRLAHSQILKDIAIPTFGSVEVEKGDPHGFFTLRRVFRYQDAREIVGVSESDRNRWTPLAPQGIGVVIELSPTFNGAEIDTHAVSASDQDGRQWSEPWLLRSFFGDAMQPKNLEVNQGLDSTSRFRTIFLTGFGASTSRFSLELSAIETQWGGQTEAAQFHIEP